MRIGFFKDPVVATAQAVVIVQVLQGIEFAGWSGFLRAWLRLWIACFRVARRGFRWRFEGFKVFGGLEVLGAGDGVGFATSLATLHKFQGWADKFLSTPGDGLEDVYVGASGKLGPVNLEAVYHDFSAEDSSDDFGTEWNIGAVWPVTKQFSTALKMADFSSDNKQRYDDTTKVWLTLQFKL